MKRRCNKCKVVYDTNIGHYCKGSKHTTEWKSKFRKYYKFKGWSNIRIKVYEHQGGRCAMCEFPYNSSELQGHHIIKVEDLYNSSASEQEFIDKFLDASNVVMLCKSCHPKVDKKHKSGTLPFKYTPLEEEYIEYNFA